MAASSSHPAAETVTNSILRASLVVKIVGFSVANAAAQTNLGQRLGFASLLSSRSSLASLQLYTLDDGVGTILSEIAIAAIENVILRYSSPSLALGALVSDAMLAAPFSRLLRVVASPWPRLDSTEAAHVARQLQRSEIHAVVAAQALRAFIRSSVYLTRRYLQGNTYLRPQAVICQTIATTVDAAFVSYVALVGTSKLLQYSRFASRFSVWAVVYGGLWTLGCGLSAFVTQKLNRLAQPFIARCLYHKLPGPKNPLQRLFDIRQLNVQFGHLTANELTELSKFANEALRSAAINQNTRLHAVRYLASLTAYVKAVNNGTLDRTVAKRRHAETASPFVRHVFTDEYLAHCHVIGSAPHACVSCQKEFVANEHAECLRCGHQVHTSDHRVPPGQRPCNDLISDWCPACVCPIHATNNEQHRKIYVQMRHYVDSLAAEWQTCQIIPTSLNNSEWGLVAQYARRHQVVEGEVPLDVIPSDQQPGQLALFDLVLASVVWALRFAPIEPNPHMFVLLNGW